MSEHSLNERLEHCERVLAEAMRQLRTDAQIMFEGAPHTPTAAEDYYEEYNRKWGVGRK